VTGAAAAAGAAGERFALDFQLARGSWRREPLSSCCGTRFEEALPARPFRFGKGLQSFAGWWYFATTGSHVGFESWLERDHLMLMDFDPDVVAVSSQPFWLRWADGRGRSRRHAPDFFARRADGSAVVVDVRPEERVPAKDAEVFAVTAQACEAAGWEYRQAGTWTRCWSLTCGGCRAAGTSGAWSRRSPQSCWRPSPAGGACSREPGLPGTGCGSCLRCST
jgi:hypothetical protein